MQRIRQRSKRKWSARSAPATSIMVKGSLGSRMKTIVTALEKRYPGNAALSDVAV